MLKLLTVSDSDKVGIYTIVDANSLAWSVTAIRL